MMKRKAMAITLTAAMLAGLTADPASDLAMSSVNFFISGIVVSQTGFEFFIPAINV